MSELPVRDVEIDAIAQLAQPLGRSDDLDPLLERLGDATYVLLGEASHGTADYYGWRAAITRRLIVEHGFSFVAVEGDWPDCMRVNRWAKGDQPPDRAEDVLAGFDRWPTWMWANTEVARFVNWLRDHNRRTGSSAGFYGLDVYSLWDSLRAVLRYLEDGHSQSLEAARRAFECFEPHGADPSSYARASGMVPGSCEDEVIDLLVALRTRAHHGDGDGVGGADHDAELDALQNAEVVAGAEHYYRTMIRADSDSWNIRDMHMADTLDRLVTHHGPGSRAVVWAHNTHVGDARATDMAIAGMTNLGQACRERHGDHVALVGFGGHRGTVIAGDFWGAPPRPMTVPPAPADTHEGLIHQAVGEPSLFVWSDDHQLPWLDAQRGHRAIGVVYRPQMERRGNWVPTVMGRRYDVFVSLDSTQALTPLVPGDVTAGEYQTYPWTM